MPPLGQLAGLAVAVVAVAVLASVGPLRRAGRIEPAHGVVAAWCPRARPAGSGARVAPVGQLAGSSTNTGMTREVFSWYSA